MSSPAPEILVVEDNSDDLFFLGRLLRKAMPDKKVHVVTDGREAIAYLQAQPGPPASLPRLVLLDLKMPFVSGFEVLQWLRSHEATAQLPVIILTSSPEEKDIRRAAALSANAYCVKYPPVDAFVRLGAAMNDPAWPGSLEQARLPDLI